MVRAVGRLEGVCKAHCASIGALQSAGRLTRRMSALGQLSWPHGGRWGGAAGGCWSSVQLLALKRPFIEEAGGGGGLC